jgi:hypothetical protein
MSTTYGQVVGLLAPKGLARRPCCSRGQRLARFSATANGVEAARGGRW